MQLYFWQSPVAEYLLHQVTPALERTVTCAGSELSSLFITQHSQCDCANNFWGSRHTPVPKRSTIVMGNRARYTVHVCQRVHVWLGKEVSKTNQSWPITRQIAGLFTERCEERRVEEAARLCLKLRWAEVNWQGDGRNGGREGGRAEGGWLTWAFVGRWWEAPPWPPSQNAKQRCYCAMSAARFSGNQKQTTKKIILSSLQFNTKYLSGGGMKKWAGWVLGSLQRAGSLGYINMCSRFT